MNLGSPKQLQEVLFDELQLPKTRKTKTGYSTDAAVLADLQETNPHPFLDLLLQHREATKLRQRSTAPSSSPKTALASSSVIASQARTSRV